MTNAFQVTKGGQSFDYRIPEILNLDAVREFFEKEYKVLELKQSGRHVTGILNNGSGDVFLKLATTPGISLLNENEYKWNEEFNKEANSQFQVPKNISSGNFNGLFFLITEKLEGEMLSVVPGFELQEDFVTQVSKIIDFSEYIMGRSITGIGKPDAVTGNTPQEWFVNKTNAWFEAIPEDVRTQNGVQKLLEIVKDGAQSLATKPRHGDFTPWHLMKLTGGELALLDGEHAMSDGVEYYDIAYLIQRVHSISKRPDIAMQIVNELKKRNYNINSLKTVLAARGVGGYLDASLAQKSDFSSENAFRDWVLSL